MIVAGHSTGISPDQRAWLILAGRIRRVAPAATMGPSTLARSLGRGSPGGKNASARDGAVRSLGFQAPICDRHRGEADQRVAIPRRGNAWPSGLKRRSSGLARHRGPERVTSISEEAGLPMRCGITLLFRRGDRDFHDEPRTLPPGEISRRISIRLPTSSPFWELPVALRPPGRARLRTLNRGNWIAAEGEDDRHCARPARTSG